MSDNLGRRKLPLSLSRYLRTNEGDGSEYIAATKAKNEAAPREAGRKKTTKDTRTFTTARLRGMSGMQSDAFAGYVKQSGVARPKQGGRTYRFPHADAVTIFETILDNSTSQQDIAKAKGALDELLKPGAK